jgi:hypothetical protein
LFVNKRHIPPRYGGGSAQSGGMIISMNTPPEEILTYFFHFSIMAFAGWIIEAIYRSYTEKKFANAGMK